MSEGRGRFVVFEGGEASGKSTQARLLSERIGALLTHEPGGSALGEPIRQLLLDPATGPVDPRAEALLMLADRAQHVATVVEPALSAGRHVVSDRFSGSTLAYQGYGRGLAVSELAELCRWAAAGVEPDLVVFLDVPVPVARSRQSAGPDRLEAEATEFHERVRAGFGALAAADPGRWCVLDGAEPVAELAEQIAALVHDRLSIDPAPR